MTFDVTSYNDLGARYQWQRWYELFSICRACHKATIFVVSQLTGSELKRFKDPEQVMNQVTALNDYFNIERFVSLRDHSKHSPPEFIPENIKLIFSEGATCISLECWNAAGTMFRQSLDLATKSMLPESDAYGLTKAIRGNLASRLSWLFENKLLPDDLMNLAKCIREDGNDGAHDGTLKKEEALDLLDFTTALLNRIYTEPEKIKQAEKRRLDRRGQKTKT